MTVARIPLVIDTDTAQDDCVALLVGLLDPRADLRAITMVAGNVGFERQVLNANLTLNAAGRPRYGPRAPAASLARPRARRPLFFLFFFLFFLILTS